MKKAIMGVFTLALCGCQLGSLFNLFQVGKLTSPAHISVKAPLTSPAHLKGSTAYRIQSDSTAIQEIPAPNVLVYCPYDRSLSALTNDQGVATLEIPTARGQFPIVLEAEIPASASGSVMRLTCFALAGESQTNAMSTATTLLVSKMGKDIRQFQKTLPDILSGLDINKLRESAAAIERDVAAQGGVSQEIISALFKDAIEPISDVVLQRAGVKLEDVSQAYLQQEATENFQTCDFAPLIDGATWEYNVIKGPATGTWTETMSVFNAIATTSVRLDVPDRTFLQSDPLVLAWLNRPFNFTIATNGQTRQLTLTNYALPAGIKNPYFPGLEQNTQYTGLARGTTWTAYDNVKATVRALFPSYTIGTTTYNRVVLINYEGTDWANRARNYSEYRADGVGRIKLVSNDFTTLELKRFSKP